MYKIIETFKFVSCHNFIDAFGIATGSHGHDWNVKITAITDSLNEMGQVIEYKTLRELVQEEIDKFDQKYLNEMEEFKGMNPTEEIIAALLHQVFSEKINNGNIKISEVEIWELEKRRVVYYE